MFAGLFFVAEVVRLLKRLIAIVGILGNPATKILHGIARRSGTLRSLGPAFSQKPPTAHRPMSFGGEADVAVTPRNVGF